MNKMKVVNAFSESFTNGRPRCENVLNRSAPADRRVPTTGATGCNGRATSVQNRRNRALSS